MDADGCCMVSVCFIAKCDVSGSPGGSFGSLELRTHLISVDER